MKDIQSNSDSRNVLIQALNEALGCLATAQRSQVFPEPTTIRFRPAFRGGPNGCLQGR
jgi:hypothetical protein